MDNNNDDISFEITKKDHSNKPNPITVKKRESSKRGNYILGETIGQGAFAKVKLATHMFTQEKVAIKILNKTKLIEKSKDIVRIQKEISILKRLRHKNIIHLYEIMESASSLYIVMDYCEGKELFDFIIKRKRLTEREACRFFQQIINGVEYLHLQNITHRDLKPENLLLDSKKRIKISDFGLSAISEESDSLLQTACGTPSYAPPEMLRGDEYLGAPSDIWSCGIILYTMICGNLPCVESKEELIYQCFLNKTFDFPSYLSHNVIDLLERLLKFNPKERINFAQIKRHQWFNIVRPQLKPGIILDVHKIPIDEQILNQVELFGYDKQQCFESVSLNKYDQFCAIYYFLLKKFSREGKSSISDMHSNEYEKYIQDISNWLHQEDINSPKYKDYWIEKTMMSRNEMNKLNLLYLTNKEDNNSQSSRLNSQNSDQQSIINSNQVIEVYFKKKIDEELKRHMMFSDNDTSMNSNSVNNNNMAFIKSNSTRTTPKQITFTSSSKKTKQRQWFYSQAKQNKYPKYAFNLNNVDDHKNHGGLLLLGEEFDERKRDILKQKLLQSNIDFNNDINTIDNNCSFNSSNIIPQIAKKLINTTVFSKFLLSKKAKTIYKEELQEKFYLVQKYKKLVEIIKSTRINLFPKRIYDWNYNAFEDYLYDEEDYIFGDLFTQTNVNNGFVDNLLKTIKARNRLNPTRFLSKNFTSKKNDSFFKCDLFSFMKASRRRTYKARKNKKCIVIPTSSFINETSIDKSISINQSLNDTLGSQKNCNPTPVYKSKYSSSTMNDISEDEELLQLNNNNDNNSSPEIPNKPNRGITVKGIPMSKIPQPLTEHLLNNDIRARTKFIHPNDNSSHSSKSNKSLFLIENKSKSNQEIILSPLNSESNPLSSKRLSNVLNIESISPSRNQWLNKKNPNNDSRLYVEPFLQLNSIINSSNIVSVSSINTNSTLKLPICKCYDGPVDFWCVSSRNRDNLLALIKQYFKKINYFCKVFNLNTIKCSQANISIEIELMVLKDTSMYYLKIKRKKGEGIQSETALPGLLKYLHLQ